MNAEVLTTVIVAISGAALVGIGRGVSKFVGRAFRRELRDVIESVVDEKLEPIMKRTEELVPNHGSSLADAVRRIERRLGHVEEQMDEAAESA